MAIALSTFTLVFWMFIIFVVCIMALLPFFFLGWLYRRVFVYNTEVRIKEWIGNTFILHNDLAMDNGLAKKTDENGEVTEYEILWLKSKKKSFPKPSQEYWGFFQHRFLGKRKLITLDTKNFEDFIPVKHETGEIGKEEALKDWKIRNMWMAMRQRTLARLSKQGFLTKYGPLLIPVVVIAVAMITQILLFQYGSQAAADITGTAAQATAANREVAQSLGQIIDKCLSGASHAPLG